MLFGTSGIRDLYGSKITPELAMGIANSFAEKGREVAIAADFRETGEILKLAAISGILAKGAGAVDLGRVPTPTLAYYTQKRNGTGIVITASHNPSEYNGLKLYRNGREISKKEESEVEAGYAKGIALCGWKEVGKIKNYENAVREHLDMVKKNVDSAAIRNAGIKVAVDCNGVGSVATPLLLRELGCEVKEINKTERGFVRESEPNAKNLSGLAEAVRREGADLGIGHDGDADRAIILDEKGEMLGLDVQFAIAIENELKKAKGAVVSTVEASLLIKETIEKNGGKDVMVGVGSAKVSEEMENLNSKFSRIGGSGANSNQVEKAGAVFGGEPSGEYIYRGGVGTPDGLMVAAKFLEIFAKQGKFSELKKKYRTYRILREKFWCAERMKAMEKIMKILSLGGKRNTIDGVREDFPDGFVLVRASGTEHAIRLTAEFKTEERLEEMAGKAREIIKEAL